MIVHAHIPHTGGTSIRQLLVDRLRTASYAAGAVRSGLVSHGPRDFLRAAIRKGFEAATGHWIHVLDRSVALEGGVLSVWREGNYWVWGYLRLPEAPPLRLVTTLRDPLVRAAVDGLPNLQCAYILGAPPSAKWGPDYGEAAFEEVRRWWWVGQTARLSDDWSSLCAALGIEEEPPRWENKGGARQRKANPARNRADLRLWELVQEHHPSSAFGRRMEP